MLPRTGDIATQNAHLGTNSSPRGTHRRCRVQLRSSRSRLRAWPGVGASATCPALGAGARYWLGGAVQLWVGSLIPYGTLGVNVLGCLLIGVVTEVSSSGSWLPDTLRVPRVVGLLGGFTTYSAFGYESVRLLREGQMGEALSYVGATTVLGLGAVAAGIACVRLVSRI